MVKCSLFSPSVIGVECKIVVQKLFGHQEFFQTLQSRPNMLVSMKVIKRFVSSNMISPRMLCKHYLFTNKKQGEIIVIIEKSIK